MRINLTLGPADIVILLILGILMVLAVIVVIGFFKKDK